MTLGRTTAVLPASVSPSVAMVIAASTPRLRVKQRACLPVPPALGRLPQRFRAFPWPQPLAPRRHRPHPCLVLPQTSQFSPPLAGRQGPTVPFDRGEREPREGPWSVQSQMGIGECQSSVQGALPPAGLPAPLTPGRAGRLAEKGPDGRGVRLWGPSPEACLCPGDRPRRTSIPCHQGRL